MHWRVRKALELLEYAGLDISKASATARGIGPFLRNLKTIKMQLRSSGSPFAITQLSPCLADRFASGGVARGHYFHQDLLVARRVFETSPRRHVDVGSRVDGFAAHVAAFRAIEIFDIRAIDRCVPNMQFLQADFMKPLPPALVGYTDSASCLHALEHFGLGRYGDDVQADGHLTGLVNLHSMLQPGGTLHLSVPIGPQRIEFDAHRVFSIAYLLRTFAGRFTVRRFSFVDDRGDLHEDEPLGEDSAARNFGCSYGCGIFELLRH